MFGDLISHMKTFQESVEEEERLQRPFENEVLASIKLCAIDKHQVHMVIQSTY